jgi:hypothetical protein
MYKAAVLAAAALGGIE